MPWRGLKLFDPYRMMPAGWGHSLLLGRVEYHMKWTIADLAVHQCAQVLRYLAAQPQFPEVTPFGKNSELDQRLLNVDSLKAYQTASAMIMMPLALACVEPTPRTILQTWRLQTLSSPSTRVVRHRTSTCTAG